MDAQASRPRIALIDGNSFYCSCERAMNPAYEGRPLVVLSNNDGCAIARTQEAKDLGIKMGAPWFQIRYLQARGLVALSANFNLYGDLSQRMMNILGQFSPRQEIYSIDESFLDLSGLPGSGREIGQAIRSRVRQWVGIPTCVGIGDTKTLAKLANHLAKFLPRHEGVCDLSGLAHEALMRAIRHVPIQDVWGIGRKLAPQLQAMHIHTAADLANADAGLLRRHFSIVVANTAQELRGQPCLTLEDIPPPKQQIMCSRSFGHAVYQQDDLQEAISVFTCRAAEKLRAQSSLSAALYVFARTSHHQRKTPQYSGGIVVPLPHPTDDTSTLLKAAHRGLQTFYRPGFAYAKAGVCLLDVQAARQTQVQGSLFPSAHTLASCSSPVMAALDAINQRFGHAALKPASALHRADAPWMMRQERKSPNYTTSWKELIEVS